MESSGVINAGKGAVIQNDGAQRMDCSIMSDSLEYGAISSLRGFENPISIARLIMEENKGHGCYSFDFATKIAENSGISFSKLKKSEPSDFDDGIQSPLGETCGAVALDSNGHLCAGTSTGGRKGCAPGRIGDSSTIGAGTYCNDIAAVSNTGHGEWIVKMNSAKRIVDLIQFDLLHPQEAVTRAGIEYENHSHSTIGSISVDKDGNWGVNIVGKSMNWAMVIVEEDKPALLVYGCAKGDEIRQALV